MLICLDLHALYPMPYFPMLCSSFCSWFTLGLHAHMLVWCCWLCLAWIYVLYVFISMLYGYILVFTCIYAWIHVLLGLCAKLPHVYMHVSMPICLDLCFHMLVCLDLCSLHALCYLPCACVLHAMFVCLDLGYVCCAMCYCSPFVALSFFLVFLPNGWNPI